MTVAHITGAARGIGKAIALRLAQDGHDVAVSDLHARKGELDALREEIEACGRRSVTLTGDVSDQDSVREMIADTVSHLGSLDVFIANAGIAQTKPLLLVTPEEYDRIHAVNGRGVFLCYAEAAREMIKQGTGGKIVGASSAAGHKASGMMGVYSSSKFGVRALTQAAAQEWGHHGITVNAYCPGLIDTDMLAELDRDLDKINGVGRGESMKAATTGVVLGRKGKVEDVAGLVSFLAGPDSNYITGQSLLIDGGMIFT